jgi:hypothetical protein
MKELFRQSFNYATIRVYKNYSDRLTRNLKPETIEVYGDIKEIDPLQEPVKKYTITAMNKPLVNDLKLYAKRGKKTCFFHTTTPNDSFENHSVPGYPVVEYEGIELVNPIKTVKGKDCFETTKDRHIKAFYNNPFASINIVKIDRWIKQHEDKITMKMFVQSRNRDVNNIYFRKSTSSTTIVFNLRTGNFTIVVFQSGKKKKQKHFYCNSFSTLKAALPSFYSISGSYVDKDSPVYKEYVETFDIIPFQITVKEALGFKEISFGTAAEIIGSNFISEWIPRFVEIKKIKLPDDGERLLMLYYPTEKYLKKNGYKLAAAVLDRFKMKSKVTIKILHKHPNIDLIVLRQLCDLFGDNFSKYIGNINDDVFVSDRENTSNDPSTKQYLLDPERRKVFNISNSEKECIINIVNDCSIPHQSLRGISGTIMDHFVIIERIKPYYPDVRLNARKFVTFNNEHSLYAKYEREIRKGYSIEHIFNDAFVKEIEKPIEITELDQKEIPRHFETNKERKEYEDWLMKQPVQALQRVFLPKLLRTSDDYYEEGSTQNNCVAGYLNGTEYSIIVSLRLNATERVTCEFSVKDRKLMQSKYYHNTNPPVYFEKSLKILHDRIKSIPVSIKPIETKKVPLVINGVVVKPLEDIVHPVLQGVV